MEIVKTTKYSIVENTITYTPETFLEGIRNLPSFSDQEIDHIMVGKHLHEYFWRDAEKVAKQVVPIVEKLSIIADSTDILQQCVQQALARGSSMTTAESWYIHTLVGFIKDKHPEFFSEEFNLLMAIEKTFGMRTFGSDIMEDIDDMMRPFGSMGKSDSSFYSDITLMMIQLMLPYKVVVTSHKSLEYHMIELKDMRIVWK